MTDRRAADLTNSVEVAIEKAAGREERSRLLATLVRQFGDLDLAEEVASDAVTAALQHWPVDGVPAKPAAWLLTTARRRAVDLLRRDRAGQTKDPRRPHPVPVPEAHELPDRLPGVLHVVYLIFTEGYAASAGTELVRADLADEAIRLARILHRLLPHEREVTGLLALLLLVDARRDARTGPDGALVLLADQDRSRWDRAGIEEGRALVVRALTGPNPGPYALQAAIAAVHDEAADVATTDWPQVVALYDVLAQVAPSPLVALNRAVAVAMRDGPASGLALLDELADDERLRGYHLLPAARADLLRRLERSAEAAAAYRHALELVGNEPERAFLQRRLAEVDPTA